MDPVFERQLRWSRNSFDAEQLKCLRDMI
jgi:hypothetical protein